MSDRESDQGRKKPLDERIKERARDLIRDILEALDGVMAPAPAPVPVRVRPRRR